MGGGWGIFDEKAQLYQPLAPGPGVSVSFLCGIIDSFISKVSIISCHVSMSMARIAWCLDAPCAASSSSSSPLSMGAAKQLVNCRECGF